MKFSKLSATAKKVARDWYRETLYETEWWEPVYTDAVHVGALMGIHIHDRMIMAVNSPDINFVDIDSRSGGCSYTGRLDVAGMHECLAKVLDECPMDADLHEIARHAETTYGHIAAVQVAARMDRSRVADWDDCIVSAQFAIFKKDRPMSVSIRGDYFLPAHVSVALDGLVSAFAAWIHGQLSKLNDDLEFSENIDVLLEENDYEFTKNGKPR